MNRIILLLGSGKSSGVLIDYLIAEAEKETFILRVADVSAESVLEKTKNRPRSEAIACDLSNTSQLASLIEEATLVISMLPPAMHLKVAKVCVDKKKNLITASYVSPEMSALKEEITAAGLSFVSECGLDPGIDHMSAMKIIDALKNDGAQITSFKSYTGGLIAPESIDNPWGYKFTWNPRNVILAGQNTARYIENGRVKYLPYQHLFREAKEINVEGFGVFDGYANRDSLSYIPVYGLEGIQTMIRGTLRYKNFCKAWHSFVELGITDDNFVIENSASISYEELLLSFIPSSVQGTSTKEKFANYLNLNNEPHILQMVESTGIFENKRSAISEASPAKMLQHLLEDAWKLKDDDKDMIVMQHEMEYYSEGKKYALTSDLVVTGLDKIHTAMAKTVGLPLGILAILMLNHGFEKKGLFIPVIPELYNPLLKELSTQGIHFKERTELLN